MRRLARYGVIIKVGLHAAAGSPSSPSGTRGSASEAAVDLLVWLTGGRRDVQMVNTGTSATLPLLPAYAVIEVPPRRPPDRGERALPVLGLTDLRRCR